jgi:uracil-DNA glycosylase family 4
MTNNVSSKQRIIRSLKNQLETDLFLGGRWLPMAPPDLTAKQTEIPQEKLETMPKPSDPKIVAEKSKKLEALAERARQCTKCPLHKTRTNAVPGQGNPDARIVFVGEAPGADEDAQGLAFVGRAGQLLTKIIEAMGLKREEVYIGNILKCRPPGNRDPQVSEIMACVDYLYEQLDVIQPEIIVALGAHAARTLLESTKAIGELRGCVHQFFPSPMHDPIKLVATYHPAYLLRNYTQDSRRRVWDDMQVVLRELHLPIPKRNS